MKVIAKMDGDSYMCKVGHCELEHFLGLYYNQKGRLNVGDTVNLAEGHDFAQDTKRALDDTRKFIESNKKVIRSILDGVSLVGRIKAPRKEG